MLSLSSASWEKIKDRLYSNTLFCCPQSKVRDSLIFSGSILILKRFSNEPHDFKLLLWCQHLMFSPPWDSGSRFLYKVVCLVLKYSNASFKSSSSLIQVLSIWSQSFPQLEDWCSSLGHLDSCKLPYAVWCWLDWKLDEDGEDRNDKKINRMITAKLWSILILSYSWWCCLICFSSEKALYHFYMLSNESRCWTPWGSCTSRLTQQNT